MNIKYRLIGLFFLLLLFSTAFSEQRVGFITGTFDPFHNGHLLNIEKAQGALKLDKIILLPNFDSKHKDNESPFPIRYSMLKALTSESKFSYISLPEEKIFLENPDTGSLLKKIREIYGGENLYFQIMGTDSFNKLVEYKLLEEVLKTQNLIIIKRAGYQNKYKEIIESYKREFKIFELEDNAVELSSSKLRGMVLKGEDIGELVPDPILQYINRHHIYK